MTFTEEQVRKECARCLGCVAGFTAEREHLHCPDCGGEKLTLLTGRDLTLKEIEAC